MTPFNYLAGYTAGYRISGKNRLAGYPAAGYPANSVSGATLIVYYGNWTKPLRRAVYLDDELQLGIENLFKLDKIADFLDEHPIQR